MKTRVFYPPQGRFGMSRLAIPEIDVKTARKNRGIFAESALILIGLAETAMELYADVSYNRNRAGQVVCLPCFFVVCFFTHYDAQLLHKGAVSFRRGEAFVP